jgi:hypothetical protein
VGNGERWVSGTILVSGLEKEKRLDCGKSKATYLEISNYHLHTDIIAPIQTRVSQRMYPSYCAHNSISNSKNGFLFFTNTAKSKIWHLV